MPNAPNGFTRACTSPHTPPTLTRVRTQLPAPTFASAHLLAAQGVSTDAAVNLALLHEFNVLHVHVESARLPADDMMFNVDRFALLPSPRCAMACFSCDSVFFTMG